MPRSYERSYFRIPYPLFESPRLVMGYQLLQVLDCSERGLRFRAPSHSVPLVGTRLWGRLRFPRGAEVDVEGAVVWVRDCDVAIRLAEPGIPFRVILQEQIHIRRLRVE